MAAPANPSDPPVDHSATPVNPKATKDPTALISSGSNNPPDPDPDPDPDPFKGNIKIADDGNDNEFGYGCVRDPYDPSDRLKEFYTNQLYIFGDANGNDFQPKNAPIKSDVDLSKMYNIGIYNQGKLASCCPNVLAFMYEYMQYEQKEIDKWMPSRMFIWYNARDTSCKDKDVGVNIRLAIKSMTKKYGVGVCPESKWAYDANKYAEKPSDECYKIAENNRIIQWAHVKQEIDQLKAALSQGYPIIFGFEIYPSFNDAKTNGGIVSIPTPTERKQNPLGGHAVVIVGYDDTKQRFTIRNSWGSNNGDKGYYYFPYNFILDKTLCFDFWIIEEINDKIFNLSPSEFIAACPLAPLLDDDDKKDISDDIGSDNAGSDDNKSDDIDNIKNISKQDGASVISFVAGLSKLSMDDVLCSMEFAQRAANHKYSKDTNSVKWWREVSNVLAKIHWVTQEFIWKESQKSGTSFDMHEAVIKIIAAMCTGNELSIIKTSLNALKNLKDDDNAKKIFEKMSSKDGQGGFAIGIVNQDKKNGAVSFKTGAFRFNSGKNSTSFLWVKYKSSSIKFYQATQTLTLNQSLYASIRDDIANKLKGKTADFVNNITLD